VARPGPAAKVAWRPAPNWHPPTRAGGTEAHGGARQRARRWGLPLAGEGAACRNPKRRSWRTWRGGARTPALTLGGRRQVVAKTGSPQWCRLKGKDEVELWVACELRGISKVLLGVEVEAEGALTELSTMARRQWQTAAQRGGDPATRNRE
jgi:hypothetical protein